MRKKISVFLILALTLVFCLSSCGKDSGTSSGSSEDNTVKNDDNGKAQDNTENKTDEKSDTSDTNKDSSNDSSTGSKDEDSSDQERPERRNGTEEDPGELIAEADVVGKTTENERIVLKYTGTGMGFGWKDCGKARQYYVLTGFTEEGKLDAWKASPLIYYFFDDETAYDAALEAYPRLSEKNRTSLFFSVSAAYLNWWETYEQILTEVENYEIVNLIQDKEYEIIK
ncbi:MAG: hypothetical protein IKP88_00400 [Lachnospiraceae bacterium]|nr:hypothetical protein [Lachnospiraceae bacterium]